WCAEGGRDGRKVPVGGWSCGILLRRKTMKAAFGILVLYVSIPLAIVAAQSIVAHETAVEQTTAHAIVAQMVPAPAVAAR
ncbi:MAG: hypothetical protein ACJ72H_26055, partial [Candidatus Sulfotelmatobacter sp.]